MKNKRIFARYPVPKKDDLSLAIEKLANLEGVTYNESLHRYIRSRIGDIISSRELIYKTTIREKQRIEKAAAAIKVSMSLIKTESKRKEVGADILKRTGLSF